MHDLTHSCYCDISTDRDCRYIPPNKGSLTVKVIDGFMTDEDISCYPLTFSKVKQLIRTAEKSSHPFVLYSYALTSFRLYIEEANHLFNKISAKVSDIVLVMSKLLLAMFHTDDALVFYKALIGGDVSLSRRLKKTMVRNKYIVLAYHWD